MTTFCVVKDGRAYVGDKAEVVGQVCTYWFYRNVLYCKVPGFSERAYHSYSEEYSEAERHNDAMWFLLSQLPKYGYRIFWSH